MEERRNQEYATQIRAWGAAGPLLAAAAGAGMSGVIEPVYEMSKHLQRLADVLEGRGTAPEMIGSQKQEALKRLYTHPMFRANGFDMVAGRKLRPDELDQPIYTNGMPPVITGRNPVDVERLYRHPMFLANGFDMVAGRKLRLDETTSRGIPDASIQDAPVQDEASA